ncbi:helix-turn-helix domain-containing protein [Prochlorothrix hollandica]|uniref:Transcriptional regulator n=1 Tax=Prochlorothrix hollandica PCC 9006 = CALU 1027 TaxID=317619 RepID=A0A0M2PY92_PROHO|nr:helix-turn-helix transcriptional regulator [Prochlorothrix hollandica]KKJ01401.1 transcriptional regulator [Prochlorothrix hollandica PCC 9006 = CALU 1027]
MNPANIVGLRLKQAREKLGLDQADVAAALSVDYQINLDQSDISEIERQKRGVKDFELDALAKVLLVDPVWLLRGSDEDSGNA